MTLLHWSAPVSFMVGVVLAVPCAAGLWPNAMPWQYSFWLGWFAAVTFSWMQTMAKPAEPRDGGKG